MQVLVFDHSGIVDYRLVEAFERRLQREFIGIYVMSFSGPWETVIGRVELQRVREFIARFRLYRRHFIEREAA